MMNTYSLTESDNPFIKLAHLTLNMEAFSEQVANTFLKNLQAESAQIYICSYATHINKCIYSSSKNTPEQAPSPVFNQILLEDKQVILPLQSDKTIIGMIVINGIIKEHFEKHLPFIIPLSPLLSLKYTNYITENNYQREKRIIDEHILSFSISTAGKIIHASAALTDAFGYKTEEIIGLTPQELLQTPKKGSKTEGPLNGDREVKTKDGDSLWVHSTIVPTKDFLGNNTGSIYLQHDISEKKMIEEQAIRDELTGLFNRRFFNQTFSKEIDSAQRNKTCVALFIIDIDFFKKYNDTYGHHAGDVTLKQTAKAIESCFKRNGDYVFRIGGEEFGVICSITNPEDAVTLANLARRAVESLNIEHTGNTHGVVTISTGIYTTERDMMSPDPEEIYKAADVALYDAKESGRNIVKVAGQGNDIELF